MNVDLTPILAALVPVLLPTLVVFLANLGFRKVWPELVKYLGEKNAASFQARVNEVLNRAIGFGVDKALAEIQAHPASVDVKSFVVRVALEYATSHANELAVQAGQLEEKILARFASHPDVQQLYAPAAAADANETVLAKAA